MINGAGDGPVGQVIGGAKKRVFGRHILDAEGDPGVLVGLHASCGCDSQCGALGEQVITIGVEVIDIQPHGSGVARVSRDQQVVNAEGAVVVRSASKARVLAVNGRQADVGTIDVPAELAGDDLIRAVVVEGVIVEVVDDAKGYAGSADSRARDNAGVRDGLQAVDSAARDVEVRVGLKNLRTEERSEAAGVDLHAAADVCEIADVARVEEARVFVSALLLRDFSVDVVEVEARAAVFGGSFVQADPGLIKGEGVRVRVAEVGGRLVVVVRFL